MSLTALFAALRAFREAKVAGCMPDACRMHAGCVSGSSLLPVLAAGEMNRARIARAFRGHIVRRSRLGMTGGAKIWSGY
jgi:hypothetical protein